MGSTCGAAPALAVGISLRTGTEHQVSLQCCLAAFAPWLQQEAGPDPQLKPPGGRVLSGPCRCVQFCTCSPV